MSQPSKWCRSQSELVDFLAYVILYAPGDFPEEDGLDLDEAMNEIHRAVRRFAESETPKLEQLVRRAHQAYSDGDDVAAARLLQELLELFSGGQ